MRKTAMYVISILFAGATLAIAQVPAQQTPPGQPTPGQQAGRGGGQQPMPPGPNPNSQYRLGPDSMPQEGVPKGEIRGPFTLPSASGAYPGTQHTYWVYVPAQYDPAVPAALMVFQDGQAFKDENGDMRAHHVMDNLIYRREIPVMIGVFINPGRTPEQPEPNLQEWGDRTTNRPTEYNTLDDKYARVITEELMPALYKEYNISKDPEMHGIGGSSSGAIAAFTVAWERPHHFRKVLSNVGSFVNLRGGHVYPEKVLASEKKPIRVYLCDGRNDNRGLRNGVYDEKRDWFYQNVRLMKALTQKGYDVNYSWSMNLHGQKYGGMIMPEMMRWLWRDGPVSTDVYDMVERSFRQPAANKKGDADAKAIQGIWKPVKAELAGQPMADAVLKSISLKLDNGNYEVFVGGNPDKGAYTLDPTTTPKSITITGTDGPNSGKSFPAIYELEGDTLRICYDLSGAKRPTEFKSSAGTQLYLVTYNRKSE